MHGSNHHRSISCIAAGALSGVTQVGQQVMVDAYGKLKDLLKKFGLKSSVVQAVIELEANPKSTARKEVVKEGLAAAKADRIENCCMLLKH